jgi:hypothetical protein
MSSVPKEVYILRKLLDLEIYLSIPFAYFTHFYQKSIQMFNEPDLWVANRLRLRTKEVQKQLANVMLHNV